MRQNDVDNVERHSWLTGFITNDQLLKDKPVGIPFTDWHGVTYARAWITNYIYGFLWDVITHQYLTLTVVSLNRRWS